LPSVIQTLAPYTPSYGVAQIARSSLLGGGIDPAWLVNVVVWTAAFAGGAMLLFRLSASRIGVRPADRPHNPGSPDQPSSLEIARGSAGAGEKGEPIPVAVLGPGQGA
jgi:hypothetical protein